jgi:hypothetical protein
MQRGSLDVNAALKLPNARESHRQQDQQKPILQFPPPHFKFLRENTAAAISSTIAQYIPA